VTDNANERDRSADRDRSRGRGRSADRGRAKVRGRATRARLLDAAAELVPEVGWGSVTTRMVAERAEVNPGLVHYHFSSVSDLLTDAALTVARDLASAPPAVLRAAPDIATGIDRLTATLADDTGTDPTSLLLTEAFLASTRDGRLRDGLRELLTELRDGLAGWLRERGHRDPAGAALVLTAAIDGVILHRAVDPALDFTAFQAALAGLISSGEGEVGGR
jgi:AcrR family transcriptional regulator